MKEICRLVQGPVSAEVVATDAQGMIREGKSLATIDDHVVVKVPFGREGVKAITIVRLGLDKNSFLELLRRFVVLHDGINVKARAHRE